MFPRKRKTYVILAERTLETVMEELSRKCKRCLLAEIAGQEKVYESIKRMLEDMEPMERASEQVAKERLAVCKACDYLLEGMCRACGCYVELRAGTAERECPYGKWKS